MCDDGTNYVNQRSLVLYTDCFTCEEVEFLIHRIQKDLDVISRLNFRCGRPIIKIYGDNWFRFIEGIKPFVSWNCFKYKCENRHVLKKAKKEK